MTKLALGWLSIPKRLSGKRGGFPTVLPSGGGRRSHRCQARPLLGAPNVSAGTLPALNTCIPPASLLLIKATVPLGTSKNNASPSEGLSLSLNVTPFREDNGSSQMTPSDLSQSKLPLFTQVGFMASPVPSLFHPGDAFCFMNSCPSPGPTHLLSTRTDTCTFAYYDRYIKTQPGSSESSDHSCHASPESRTLTVIDTGVTF